MKSLSRRPLGLGCGLRGRRGRDQLQLGPRHVVAPEIGAAPLEGIGILNLNIEGNLLVDIIADDAQKGAFYLRRSTQVNGS